MKSANILGVSRTNRPETAISETSPTIQTHTLRDTLPVIPIPLREDEAEPTLDLQYLLQRAYDGGPYRRGAVNYAKPPNPPLTEVESTWAAQWLAPRKT